MSTNLLRVFGFLVLLSGCVPIYEPPPTPPSIDYSAGAFFDEEAQRLVSGQSVPSGMSGCEATFERSQEIRGDARDPALPVYGKAGVKGCKRSFDTNSQGEPGV